MGTKERIAERMERLARLVPGIGSYQDKEGRREADKRLRVTLADRLDSARKALEDVIAKVQSEGLLDNLDRLGRLDRKLHKAADSIRFASYGYSGVFDAVKIDEAALERLYAFEVSLAESVSDIRDAADGLKAASANSIGTDALEPLERQIASFDEKLQDRAMLLG